MSDPASVNQPLHGREELRFPHTPGELLRMSSAHTLQLAFGAATIAWLPLIALSALHGLESLKSFLFDIAAQSRLLVVVPLLILEEPVLVARLSAIARHFVVAGLVRKEDVAQFEKAFTAFQRRGKSLLAQLVFAVLIYTFVASMVTYVRHGVMPAWCYGMDVTNGLSGAGSWYILVSLPIVIFLLLRWVWRQLLWSLFLRRVSQLNLRLIPSHPDLMGGLSFLQTSLRGFLPFGFAVGTIVAGGVANAMIHHHQPISMFKYLPIIVTAFVVFLCAAPLCAFVGLLIRTRRRGIFEYGSLATAMGRQFEQKWIRSNRELKPDVLEVSDFSSTTDLYSVVANVRQMSLSPVGLQSVTRLVAVTLIPAIPVALVAVPFDVLVQEAIKLLL